MHQIQGTAYGALMEKKGDGKRTRVLFLSQKTFPSQKRKGDTG